MLIDEYQDLNRCDLAIIKAISDKGAEVYVAGDDDQSIYGFRQAHPEGIRRFLKDYDKAADLVLDLCKRCDKEILDLGLFVAQQDYERVPKPLQAEDKRTGAEIGILQFSNETAEANGVARICDYLVNTKEIEAEKILILLRTDRYGVFSSELRTALESKKIPVSIATSDTSPLNETAGRIYFSFLRLLIDRSDALALRSLLQLRRNKLGAKAISDLYRLAKTEGKNFSDTVASVIIAPNLIGVSLGNRIKKEVESIYGMLDEMKAISKRIDEDDLDLLKGLSEITKIVVEKGESLSILEEHLKLTVESSSSKTISNLLSALNDSGKEIEQELDPGKVNILTMHKAKGLTADAVLIVAAEDEYIPGRGKGSAFDDERRLLYVSLTRAKHYLFITHCDQRVGRQRHTGSKSGVKKRRLTPFLKGAPIKSQHGTKFVNCL